MGERIIDYPEALTIANDDYVLLDGITGGSKKILASELGGGGGGNVPELQVMFNSGQTGEETYTITENGKYLIVVSYSYNGSGSITLPSGITAEIDESVLGNARGFRAVVANLTAGDVVTMSNSIADWTGRAKTIIKLKNIPTLSTKIGSGITDDGTVNPVGLQTTGDALFIGLCCGRLNGSFYDYSYDNGGVVYAGYVGSNTLIRINYIDSTLFSSAYLYGYDGGYGGYIVLQ